jgi:hypothetical protein
MTTEKQFYGKRPACVSMEEAAAMFGWPNYYLPFLVRAGHLKPLGKPMQNARKWFPPKRSGNCATSRRQSQADGKPRTVLTPGGSNSGDPLPEDMVNRCQQSREPHPNPEKWIVQTDS